jgi:hypothetical protein
LEHTINNPEFRNFLKKYDNPVIILDDCESTLIDLFGKTNNSTFNIIQLIDGLSSDSLKLSVICIFNEKIEENKLIKGNYIKYI